MTDLEVEPRTQLTFPNPPAPHIRVHSFIKDVLHSYSMPDSVLVTRGTKIFKSDSLSASSLQPRIEKSLTKSSHYLWAIDTNYE